ncbi:MAG: lipoprotein-releasing ABC transporter permease subunit [Sandaracinaceae bacterium]
MIGSTTTRYALRSLARSPRRTALSVLGLAFGVGFALFTLSWVRGLERMSVEAAAGGGLGHLRIAPDGWLESHDEELRLREPDRALEAARAMPWVEVATPRASVGGLLGLGTRTAHVTLTGVDARTEPRVFRYLRGLSEGRYLEPDERDVIVLGRAHARRLHAQVGDELVVTVVDASGELASALVTVVGIIDTGSRAIDATIAHVALADVERLSGRPGAAEITLLARELGTDPEAVLPMRDELARALPEGDEALSWLDLVPDLRLKIDGSYKFSRIATGIILLVVLLGIASAQLTSVLERRKELAVLAAIGMRGLALVRVVVTEALLLGLVSTALALAWSVPLVRHLSIVGIDLRSLWDGDEGIAFAGVLIDPVFHPHFGVWMFPTALVLAVVATVLSSLYPAWFASRTDPAAALRVDR